MLKHLDDSGLVVTCSAFSFEPECPEASALSPPQPGTLAELAVAGALPNADAERAANGQPLHSSAPVSGWSVSGDLVK